MTRTLLTAALFAAASILPQTTAFAADYIQTSPAYAGDTSYCSDRGVLASIDHKFNYKARNYLRADLDIVDIRGTRETRWIPPTETARIERHYCRADVVMNDGQPRTMWYLLEGGMGFAGIGDNVEFCIAGLDPWHVYGANCDSVR